MFLAQNLAGQKTLIRVRARATGAIVSSLTEADFKLSKAGAALAAPTGTIAELGASGVYLFTPSAGDVDTLGELAIQPNNTANEVLDAPRLVLPLPIDELLMHAAGAARRETDVAARSDALYAIDGVTLRKTMNLTSINGGSGVKRA